MVDIKKLLDEATDGPWDTDKPYDASISGTMHNIIAIAAPLSGDADKEKFDAEGIAVVITPHVLGWEKELPQRHVNAQLIAASRTCLPDALAELERAKAALQSAMAELWDELHSDMSKEDFDDYFFDEKKALQSITEFEKKWSHK